MSVENLTTCFYHVSYMYVGKSVCDLLPLNIINCSGKDSSS